MHTTPSGLDRASLTDAVWSFGRADNEHPYATQLRLLDSGRVAGYRNDNEHRWELRDGVLALLDRAGIATTVFDHCETIDGRLVLEGSFRGEPTRHVLRQVPPLGALATDAERVSATAVAGLRPRRNLVIVRAGADSVHRDWTQDIDRADRTWDLCVSWYGRPEKFDEDPHAQYHVIQDRTQKWPAIHCLLHPDSPFWLYDYVLCPDDDLAWSWRGVNVAFETMRDFDLMLAQPSLDPDGHVIHAITQRVEGSRVRFTTFVEVMTPIFSREALRLCAPTFGLSQTGFGLDHLWPKMLGEPECKIGIIDQTAVTHTRPQGERYDLASAINEGRRLTESFKAVERYEQLGSIRTE